MQYDKTQIKTHPKRNLKQKKMVKDMLYQLDLMFGEYDAGEILAMLVDCLNKLMKEKTPCEELNLRSIEIKLNNCYSVKLNCITNEYEDD